MSDHEQDSGTVPFHNEGGAIIFEKPKSEEEVARQRREDEQHEFARAQVKTNKTLALFTGLLVLATFCTIGVGLWQARISQVAANAAKSASDTASATLREMQTGQGAQDTHALAQQAASQATQTGYLATAARTQADTAQAQLKHSDNQFRVSQRPWVDISVTGVDSVLVAPNLAAVKLEFGALNAGHSVATNASFLFFLVINGKETGQECTPESTKQQTAVSNGNAVFPTESITGYRTAYNPMKSLSGGDVRQSPNQFPDFRLIACVIYDSTVDRKTHRTRRIYGIDSTRAQANPYPPNNPNANSILWTNNLRLVPMLEYTKAD